MMNEKVINKMKSEMKTLSHNNGHICPEIDNKIDDIDADVINNVNYDFEDDVLSDVDYDSDAIEEKLSFSYRQTSDDYRLKSKSVVHFCGGGGEEEYEKKRGGGKTINFMDDMEQEAEFSDDDDDGEEDRQIEHSIYIKLENKKYASALEGLSVLNGKLNWLEEKAHIGGDVDSFVKNDKDYPNIPLNNISIVECHPIRKSPKRRSSSGPKSPRRFYPTKHIAVKIGNKTFIEFKKEHQQVEQKKLCNAIKDGKECRFGDRCKFLHQMPNRQQKPICKYGIKCGNKKCTFVHPDGKIINIVEKRLDSTGPALKTSRTKLADNSLKETKFGSNHGSQEVVSFDPSSYRKIWLCKNVFKISKTTGEVLYESIKIEEIGNCRFGDHCIYAHSLEEIRQNVESCKFKEECKGVKITQIQKDDKKVRRYENNFETRKCCRLHPKERFIDYIKRIQLNNEESRSGGIM
jgi:hypothetical protein